VEALEFPERNTIESGELACFFSIFTSEGKYECAREGEGELIQKRHKPKDRLLTRIGVLPSLEGDRKVMIYFMLDVAKRVPLYCFFRPPKECTVTLCGSLSTHAISLNLILLQRSSDSGSYVDLLKWAR
jgi:hypothetical protein